MVCYPTQKLPSTVPQYDQIGSRCAPLSSQALFRNLTSYICLSFQGRLREHFQELFLGSHIDGLCHQFAITVIDEGLGDAVDHKHLVYFASRIEQHWKHELPLPDKWFHFCRLFIRDSKNHQSLRREPFIQGLQIRHLLAAWWTPRRPEIHQHHLAPQIGKC